MASRRSRHRSSPLTLFSFQDIITCITGILVLMTLLLTLELVLRSEVAQSVPDAASRIDDLEIEIVALESQDADLAARLERNTWLVGKAGNLSPASAAFERDRAKSRMDQLERERRELAMQDAELSAEQEQINTSAAAIQEKIQTVERQKQAAEQAANQAVAKLTQSTDALEAVRESGQLFVLPDAGNGKSAWIITCGGDKITAARIADNGALRLEQNWDGSNAKSSVMTWAVQRDSAREYFVLMVEPEGISVAEDLIQDLRGAGYDVGWDVAPKRPAANGKEQR